MGDLERNLKKNVETTSGFGLINEDLLHNILKRLPAKSFSYASCVSKSWNSVCNRILFRPKICSALSVNPTLRVRLEEVVNKVLSEPIRPQFVIASLSANIFAMRISVLYLSERLGWDIPIVASCNCGIMGRDLATSKFREVFSTNEDNSADFAHEKGISLTVGFLPGIKVRAIPLERVTRESQERAADHFVTKITEFSELVSGNSSPMAVMMFGNPNFRHVDIKSTMDKLEYTMSKETVIVGDQKALFAFRTGTEERGFCWNGMENPNSVAVTVALAFVFARDRQRYPGVGEIQFSAALSSGVSSLGPVYKAASVKMKGYQTWLTARREGQPETIDGERMLSDVNDVLEEDANYYPDIFIGVTKQRKCSFGSYKSRLTFLSFHSVLGGDHDYLFVDGPGIKTGDYFQFYCPHKETALTSNSSFSSKLRKWKQDCNSENSLPASGSASNYNKQECIGGFIFSCSGRTTVLGKDADSSIFLENFPEVPLAGVFCSGEIGRGFSILDENEGNEESKTRCCMHVYSSVCFLVTYTPALPEV